MKKENTYQSKSLEIQTLDSIASTWLQYSRKQLKESSYIKYWNLLRNHILPELGAFYPEELTTECVEQFTQKKLSEGRMDGNGGLMDKSVRDILSLLKEICSFAIQMGYEIPCHFKLLRLRQDSQEIRVLGKEEEQILGKFLLKDNELAKTGVLLSLYMGLRLGEVCALKRKHILYKEAVLQVKRTMQRIQNPEEENGRKTKIIITQPKSARSIRDIPIPPILLERLLMLSQASPDAFLLTGRADRFIEPRSLENIFKRYLRECQMGEIKYHALRHTFATRCMESGFDAKTLSEILGHANVNITLNRYVHPSMERKRENMKKLKLLY